MKKHQPNMKLSKILKKKSTKAKLQERIKIKSRERDIR